MQMNIIRSFISPYASIALFAFLLIDIGEVSAQPCQASFNVLDEDGTLLGTITSEGQELLVCNEDFLVLTFQSTSTPSTGSLVDFMEWNLNGSVISSLLDQQQQFSQDDVIDVSLFYQDLTGCDDTVSVTIKVLGQPEFTYNDVEPTCFGLCDGSLFGSYLSDNAPLYTHTWFHQGFNVGSGDITSSACGGSYNVVVTDPAGCTELDEDFTLDEPEAIEVSILPEGPLVMCPGEFETLASSQQNAALPLQSVQWSWPEGLSAADQLTTVFTANTNNLNQTLDINIVDANGCHGTASIYLGAKSASLFGTVEIDGEPCADCVINVFKIGEAGAWSPYTGISTDASGLYEIGNALGLTNTLLRMVAPDDEYPNLPAIYYPATHNWAESDVVFTGCDAAMQKDFSITSPLQMSGSTIIEGGVFYQSSGKTESEDPIPGVDVVVEKVPPGNALTVVTTDVDGRFTFEFMEETLGDTVYRFYVDLPGLPMAEMYILSVGSDDVLMTGVNYCVVEDTSEIIICDPLGVPEQTASAGQSLRMFPNPADDVVQFKVRGSAAAIAEVVLIDMTGRAVRNQRPDVSDFELSVNGLSEGIYTATVRLSDGKMLSERLMVGR